MKQCIVCKLDRPLSDYNKNKTTRDGYQRHCRECSHARFREYYRRNPFKQRAAVKERNKRVKSETQAYILDYLLGHPCVDCGEADPIVLEFDHVRGLKRANVSKMVGWNGSLGPIKEEIAKCDVRCANCHRRKTWLGISYKNTAVTNVGIVPDF